MVEEATQSVVRIELSNGSASGFIFKTDNNGSAYVMTNYHVIEGAWSVTVWVNDSRQYQGKVLGYDGKRDLAVVEICCGQFKALPFGDSDRVKAGEDVIAIGYPLNISASATVTRGIVSATRYDGFWNAFVIQTDAPINPGNSGGPLLSSDGRVVGINTASNAYSTDGRPVDGVGWAIAEQSIQHVALDLQGGKRTGGATATPQPTLTPTPWPGPAEVRWRTYINSQHGYTVQVPTDWIIHDSNPWDVWFEDPGNYATVAIIFPTWRISSALGELDKWIEKRREGNPLLLDVFKRDQKKRQGLTVATVQYRYHFSKDHCFEEFHEILTVPDDGWNSWWLSKSVCVAERDWLSETVEAIADSITGYP